MGKRKVLRRKPRNEVQSPALRHLYDRYIGDDPEQRAIFEEALANAEVALQIYDLRTKAGLSQRALASRIGTTASVICQLEDADYQGHSLSMLRRIATALNQRVVIRFVPLKTRRRTA
jgi:ribosome-binding protein aMBF1 (putative translation factor)